MSVKPTRANAKRKRCTRYVLVGRFAADAKAGAGSKRFSGTIGRKILRPGRHGATLLAKDAAGNASAPKRLPFRIVRGRAPTALVSWTASPRRTADPAPNRRHFRRGHPRARS